MNEVLLEDLETIINSELVDWSKIKGKSFLITGATGLIASILIKAVILKNKKENFNIKLNLVVRNEKKAKEMYGDSSDINYIVCDVKNYISTNEHYDYIIHTAAPTKSKFMVENPTETLDTQIMGTKNILEQAKKSNCESMVYLSSMEMYGVLNNENVNENDLGYVDLYNVRSSYPEGKRVCELYSHCYYREYNVPVKIARIAQTFGPGISPKENRVYKYFMDCAMNKENIILRSSGTTKINYIYTVDTIIGILFILLNGKNGEAYNLVGEKTEMTVYESALWIADEFTKGQIDVKVEIAESAGLAPDNEMILNNDKLKKLGWQPQFTLKDGYKRLHKYMQKY